MDNKQYLSVAQVVESPEYPFSIGQVRHMLSLRHKNGLESAVRKIGRRLYLRRDLLNFWIESQSFKGGAA